MKYKTILLIISIILFTFSIIANASFLEKRSRIELRFGMWHFGGKVLTTYTDVEVSANISGNIGTISYSYWLKENLAIDFSISMLTAKFGTDVGILGVSTHTSNVIPILVGIKYYLPESTYGKTFRPYLKAAVGPYVGNESKVEVGLQVIVESNEEKAAGLYFGGGADIILSSKFMLGINAGYNLVNDFNNPIGGRDNYSSGEFGVGISLLLGKGVE